MTREKDNDMQPHCDVVVADPEPPVAEEAESNGPEKKDEAPAKSKSPAQREKEKANDR